MAEKQGKHVGARIPDPSVWDSFIKHVEKKHGKVYGVTGLELQNALNFYLEHPEAADINEIEKNHSEELQVLQDKIRNLEKEHEIEVKKFNQKLEEINSLNNQVELLQTNNNEFRNEIKSLKEEKEQFKGYRDKLDEKTEQHDQLSNKHDKLRNKVDHLQERFNKSQDEVNSLQREIGQLRIALVKVQGMGFFDRLLNKLPEEVKQIEAPKE